MKWMKPLMFVLGGVVVALFFGDKIKSLPIISNFFNKNQSGSADQAKGEK